MKVRKPELSEITQTAHWDTWEKDISEFPWHYTENETCYIIEGKAEVTDLTGKTITFGKGYWVNFPKGLVCNWKIIEPISKKYLFH